MKEKNAQFRVIENKYIEVSGSFEIFNAKGELLKSEGPVYLCRCGLSENKPFCDGKHKNSGFTG